MLILRVLLSCCSPTQPQMLKLEPMTLKPTCSVERHFTAALHLQTPYRDCVDGVPSQRSLFCGPLTYLE